MSRQRLDQLERDYEAASIVVGEATWNTYSGEGEADLDGSQQRLAAVLSGEDDRRMIEEWDAAGAGRDALLSRRLRVWRNCFTGAVVDGDAEVLALKNRLQRRIATFEPELDGRVLRRSELAKILRREPDRERRRRAWLAAAALAEANGEELRRLLSLRNRKAREFGCRDYVDLVFRLQEIDEGRVTGLLDRLAAAARPLYRNLTASLAERIGVPRLAPWDVAYAARRFLQLPDDRFPSETALDTLARTAAGLGFPIDTLPIRTLVRDIPFGGYNVAVRIPTDTRFLVNPSEGHAFYTTMFHELGHSLQAVHTDTPWPILKEYEWSMGGHTAAFSEGMAEVFGDFARRPDWLARTAGLTDSLLEDFESRILPGQTVIRFFDLLLNMTLELAGYASEGEGMEQLEPTLIREIRLLEVPEDVPSMWEANTWYTSYPVYWQNYILASVIAAQVHETLTARFGAGASSSRDVAEHLRSGLYRSGNALPWEERLRRGTGKPLDEGAYLRRMKLPSRESEDGSGP